MRIRAAGAGGLVNLRRAMFLPLLFATTCSVGAQTFNARDPHSPLQLVRAIELPHVHGRIDHMALDRKSNHLFVAEIANGTVDDVDLASGTVVGRISTLHEPQGIAWLRTQDEIAVACGDGTVHFYRSADRHEVAQISLGDDADNLRVDPRNGQLLVGYGSGGLAVINPLTHRMVRELTLPAHPEAFEIVGSRVFVNVPDAHTIVVADIDDARILSTLSTGLLFGNFPMALDVSAKRIAVAYRTPSRVSVLDTRSGAAIDSTPICGDADDLYFRSAQLVVVCGSGAVELINPGQGVHVRIVTQPGARTGLLDAAHGQLFVAVPARQMPAVVWQLSFR